VIVHAIDTKRRVFPFRIEETVPTGSLAYCLAGVQWFDATTLPLTKYIDSLTAQMRLLLKSSADELAPLRHSPDAAFAAPSSSGSPNDIYLPCIECGQDVMVEADSTERSATCPACLSPLFVPGLSPSPADRPPSPMGEISGGSPAALVVSPAVVEQLERCMTGIVGPIGATIVRRAIPRARAMDALRAELLASIPASDDRKVFLGCCGDLFGSRAPAAAPPPVPILSDGGSRAPAAHDPAAIGELKTTFATFVGPLASVLVDRAIANARTASDLLAMLADELESQDDRKRFLRAVPAALRQES
jgi:DNA-directed RNA polymerase subunit RPC12/RpoP